VFCNAAATPDGMDNLIVKRGVQVFVILNRYPYTSGHVMVVPYAHQPTLEDLGASVRAELMELTTLSIRAIQQVYQPQGFNVGINIGASAGAGIVEHIHLHIVPRWNGDSNFMSSVAMTRVIPEALEDTFRRIKTAMEEQEEKPG